MAERYSVVMDALDGVDEIDEMGEQVILPATHIGSKRDLQQRYQDPMAVVRILGRPH